MPKISALPVAASLAGTEPVPTVQSSVTVRTSPADLAVFVLAYDAEVAAFAGLTSAADKLGYFTGSGAMALADFTAAGRAVAGGANAAAQRVSLGLVIGTNVQAYSANLTTYAGITPSANVQTFLGAANYAAMRTDLSLVVGTNVQAWDADLDGLAALSSTGLIARTGSGTFSARTLTAPAAGISVSNGDGVSGNPTLALANDLSALEALSGTHTIYYRSGTDTWAAVTIGTGLDFTGATLSATGFAGTGAITGSGLTMATARMLGRTTASTGAIEEITVGSGLSLSAGSLTASFAASSDVTTGSSTTKSMTPDSLRGSDYGKRFVALLAGSDYTTALTVADGKAYWPVPSELNGYNLVSVAAAVVTRSTSGLPTLQVARVRAGSAIDMLSTALTIDANEWDSSTAATAAVIDASNRDLATGDMIRLDCDVAGTATAGVVATLGFQKP